MACWLDLQHTGPSQRQSLPPQASKQMTFGGMAFTRVSLAWEYEGFGTGISEVIPETGCGRRTGKWTEINTASQQAKLQAKVSEAVCGNLLVIGCMLTSEQ